MEGLINCLLLGKAKVIKYGLDWAIAFKVKFTQYYWESCYARHWQNAVYVIYPFKFQGFRRTEKQMFLKQNSVVLVQIIYN